VGNTICALALAAAGLAMSTAALGADEAFGTVKGFVTVDGKPLAEGKLKLHTAGAKPIELPIKDGKYARDKVPTGTKTATVEGVGVPAKYGSAGTSPLKVEIKAGANELAFELRT
jgi:hypothetical protein